MSIDWQNIKVVKGSQVAGVEIFVTNSNEYSMRIVLIKKSLKNLSVTGIYNNIDSFNELARIVGNYPVVFSIDGKGILHKRINTVNDVDSISQIIPGNQKEQFCIQTYQSAGDFEFISFARKDFIDSLITELQLNKISIVNFILGPFSIDVLPLQQAQYPVFNYTLSLEYGRLMKIEKTENSAYQDIVHDNVKLESSYLLAYTNGLYYFEKTRDHLVLCDNSKSIKEEFLFTKLFKVAGWAALLTFLIILIVNYLFFDFYRKRDELLDQELIVNAGYTAKLEILKKEYNAKQNLIKTSGILGNTKISFYIDDLVNSIHDEVKLKKVDFQPLKEKLKDGEEIVFQSNIILVEGFSSSSNAVNNWIDEINTFSWVKKVEIVKYSQEDIENPGKFIFSIELKE